MTAGVGGSKKIYGTWVTATSTSGTITWAPANNAQKPIAAGAVYSTTVTTTGCPEIVLTSNTLVLSLLDDGAAGYWWVEVK